jgi:ABC-type Zn uptake system ZnuABC Zn-binding protein ZnuA
LTPRQVKNSKQQKLSPQQEQELVQYIKELTEKCLPPTREMIRNFASTIAKHSVVFKPELVEPMESSGINRAPSQVKP